MLLLLVQSSDDLLTAVAATSEFLAYQQRQPDADRQGDHLIGIFISQSLDDAIPEELRVGREPTGEGVFSAPFWVRSSFSLSGIWTLCWIEAAISDNQIEPFSQREALIGIIANFFFNRRHTRSETFIPVFDTADASSLIETTMNHLQARYGAFIGETWFVQNASRGTIQPADYLL
jgi:hypothetical protein